MFPAPAGAYVKAKQRPFNGFPGQVAPDDHGHAHPCHASFFRRQPEGIIFVRILDVYAHSIHTKNPRITPYYKEHTLFLNEGISMGYRCMLTAYARSQQQAGGL